MERKRLNGKFIKSGIYKTCNFCKKQFYVIASRIETSKFCSSFCKQKFGRNNPTGNKAFNWRGGKTIFKDGYVRIYMPTHPSAIKKTYILEHRYIMEKHIGRYLTPEDIVHHINRIKDDNRPENLKLTTRKKHMKHHRETILRGLMLKFSSKSNGKIHNLPFPIRDT